MIKNSAFNRKTNLVSGEGMNWKALKEPYARSISKYFDKQRSGQLGNPCEELTTQRHLNEGGIIVYGKQVGTRLTAPILIIKTKLYTKRVYTQLPCPSKDIVTHKPLPPIVVDITPYDQLLNNPNAPYDAVIMNVGGDFAFGGGTGGGLQIIGLVKGGFRGIYVYKPTMPNGNFGAAISIGVTLGFVDFNEKNIDRKTEKPVNLDPTTFEGNSQGWSGGWGPYGAASITSYVDGKWHVNDVFSMKDSDILYKATMVAGPYMSVPVDVEYGLQYTFGRSKLWLSFPF